MKSLALGIIYCLFRRRKIITDDPEPLPKSSGFFIFPYSLMVKLETFNFEIKVRFLVGEQNKYYVKDRKEEEKARRKD